MAGHSDPILLNFPDELTTERLLIRPPRPGDGSTINAAIQESLAELQPWMLWAQTPPSVADTETVCRRKAAEWLRREDLMLTLWRQSDGLFVGGSGLHRIDWSVPRMEIGYWCRTSLSGQGYITEAVRAITGFAFEHLGAQRLEIHCDAGNTRSAAVAGRAGYALEARRRNYARGVDGTLRDMLVFVRFPEGRAES
ncbi:MAG: GNAT family N-acetyltransferase [Chloroflexota bacterium]